MLARGDAAVVDYTARVQKDPKAALAQNQINRVGYWIFGKKRPEQAIAVFELNVAAHPESWNAYDSLAEAYADAGQREKAIAGYEKSVTLNPGNTNGIEQLKKLKAAAAN